MGIKKFDPMLEYRLMDILEMYYSENQNAREIVKNKLLTRPIKDKHLYPLFTFVLEDTLVVIQDGIPKRPTRLLFLNPHDTSSENSQPVRDTFTACKIS